MSDLLILFFPLGPLGFPLLGLLAKGSLSLVMAGTAGGRAMFTDWLSSVFLCMAGGRGEEGEEEGMCIQWRQMQLECRQPKTPGHWALAGGWWNWGGGGGR